MAATGAEIRVAADVAMAVVKLAITTLQQVRDNLSDEQKQREILQILSNLIVYNNQMEQLSKVPPSPFLSQLSVLLDSRLKRFEKKLEKLQRQIAKEQSSSFHQLIGSVYRPARKIGRQINAKLQETLKAILPLLNSQAETPVPALYQSKEVGELWDAAGGSGKAWVNLQSLVVAWATKSKLSISSEIWANIEAEEQLYASVFLRIIEAWDGQLDQAVMRGILEARKGPSFSRFVALCQQLETISGQSFSAKLNLVITSNAKDGKTTVINALLGDPILPAGTGHTNISLKVEHREEDGFLLHQGDLPPITEPIPIFEQLEALNETSPVGIEISLKARFHALKPSVDYFNMPLRFCVSDTPGTNPETHNPEAEENRAQALREADSLVVLCRENSLAFLGEHGIFNILKESLHRKTFCERFYQHGFVVFLGLDSFNSHLGKREEKKKLILETFHNIGVAINPEHICFLRGDLAEAGRALRSGLLKEVRPDRFQIYQELVLTSLYGLQSQDRELSEEDIARAIQVSAIEEFEKKVLKTLHLRRALFALRGQVIALIDQLEASPKPTEKPTSELVSLSELYSTIHSLLMAHWENPTNDFVSGAYAAVIQMLLPHFDIYFYDAVAGQIWPCLQHPRSFWANAQVFADSVLAKIQQALHPFQPVAEMKASKRKIEVLHEILAACYFD